jgi:hypothetical protein
VWPDSAEYAPEHAQAEYAKRQQYLNRYDGEIRLDGLIQFYGHFRPVITKVLKSRTPIWALPHREEAQEMVNRLSAEELSALFAPGLPR